MVLIYILNNTFAEYIQSVFAKLPTGVLIPWLKTISNYCEFHFDTYASINLGIWFYNLRVN